MIGWSRSCSFNSRPREEATGLLPHQRIDDRSFNSRPREEATGGGARGRMGKHGFNSRPREEATLGERKLPKKA